MRRWHIALVACVMAAVSASAVDEQWFGLMRQKARRVTTTAPLPSGIVGWWKATNTDTNLTSWLDSASTNTAIKSGAQVQFYNTDGFYAYRMNGIDQYFYCSDTPVFTPNTNNIESGLSLCGWFMISSNSVNCMLVGKLSQNNIEYRWRHNTDGTLGILFNSKNDTSNVNVLWAVTSSAITMPTNSFMHLAMVYTGSKTFEGIKMYTNGVSVSLSDSSIGTYLGVTNTAATLKIGVSESVVNGAMSLYYKGDMSGIRLYQYALTPQEVTNIVTVGRGGF